MRRITKIGAVAIALLMGIPAFAVLDLFGGAAATADAPELFNIPEGDSVRLVDYADGPLATGVLAYVVDDGSGTNTLLVRLKDPVAPPLYERSFDQSMDLHNISAIQLSRDGGSFVVGFTSGHVLYVTSTDQDPDPYDLEREFRTRSPVTDVGMDNSGAWFTAVTYHGDTFLFQRNLFVSGPDARPWFHHNPLMLFEHITPNEDNAARDTLFPEGDYPISKTVTLPLSQVDPSLEDETIVDIPLTVRPYSKVAITGQAGETTPNGIGVVATDVFGTVHMFNAMDFAGTPGTLIGEPTSIRVVERPCHSEFILGEPRSIPCDAQTLADLVRDASNANEAQLLLGAIAHRISSLAIIDLATGMLAGPMDPPIVDLKTTRGTGASGLHFTSVLVDDEQKPLERYRVHNFRSQLGLNAPSNLVLSELWTLKNVGTITSIDLANPNQEGQGKQATLAVGIEGGFVQTYRILDPSPPSHADIELEVLDTGGSHVAVRHVGITRGNGQGENGAGLYVTVVDETGRIQLFETSPESRIDTPAGEPDTPLVHYLGTMNLTGASTGLDMTDSGGALVGYDAPGSGIAVFAGMIRVDIVQEASSIDKLDVWEATAATVNPDSTIVNYTWTIEHRDGEVPPLTLYGESVAVQIFVGGVYRVNVTVEDDFNLTASDSDQFLVDVEPPWIGVQIPDVATVEDLVNMTFVGTLDPDATPGADHEGITDLTVTAAGANQSIKSADLSDPGGSMNNVSLNFTWLIPGTFGVTITVTDEDGLQNQTERQIIIEDLPDICDMPSPPPECDDDDDDNNTTDDDNATVVTPYRRVTMADQSGHVLFYRVEDAEEDTGRYRLHTPLVATIYEADEDDLDARINHASLLPDGSMGVLGLDDGTAAAFQSSDPANRTRVVDIFDDPVVFTDVTADGDDVLLVSSDADITIMSPDLVDERQRFNASFDVALAAADHDFRRIVLVGTDNVVRLVDGPNLTDGVQHTFTAASGVVSMDMPENRPFDGDTFIILGLDDGRTQTVRIIENRLFNAGLMEIVEDREDPVVGVSITELGPYARYLYSAVTRAGAGCQGTALSPCGHMVLVDSFNRGANEVPQPIRSTHVEIRPETYGMTLDARHFYVGGTDADALHVYDSIWNEGPLNVYDNLTTNVSKPAIPIDFAMDRSGATTTLLDDGNYFWLFAPSSAHYKVGPWNEDDVPVFGAPVHVGRNVTFDPSTTTPGGGTPIAHLWNLGDGTTSTDTTPVHEFDAVDDCLWHNDDGSRKCRSRLTLVTEVTVPYHAVIRDRFERTFDLWNPPPIARMTATPFNLSADQVEVLTHETVRFDGRTSEDPHPGGSIWQYQFKFGDGKGESNNRGKSSHSYSRPGLYNATLTVHDSDRFTDTTDPILIVVKNRLPTARFVYSQPDRNESGSWVTQGVPVYFDGRTSSDRDGFVALYNWTIEDGASTVYMSGSTPVYTFTSLGVANVTLKVRDNNGGWSDPVKFAVPVDDAIRLKQIHKRSDKHYLNPAQNIWVIGHVHDYMGWPGLGMPVSGAPVHMAVYYDGPYNFSRAEDPYATATLTTDPGGDANWTVPQNDANAAYIPGRYRVEMIAVWTSSFHPITGLYSGDTEYSERTETVFFVEGAT